MPEGTIYKWTTYHEIQFLRKASQKPNAARILEGYLQSVPHRDWTGLNKKKIVALAELLLLDAKKS